jgi:hypothetical protein
LLSFGNDQVVTLFRRGWRAAAASLRGDAEIFGTLLPHRACLHAMLL